MESPSHFSSSSIKKAGRTRARMKSSLKFYMMPNERSRTTRLKMHEWPSSEIGGTAKINIGHEENSRTSHESEREREGERVNNCRRPRENARQGDRRGCHRAGLQKSVPAGNVLGFISENNCRSGASKRVMVRSMLLLSLFSLMLMIMTQLIKLQSPNSSPFVGCDPIGAASNANIMQPQQKSPASNSISSKHHLQRHSPLTATPTVRTVRLRTLVGRPVDLDCALTPSKQTSAWTEFEEPASLPSAPDDDADLRRRKTSSWLDAASDNESGFNYDELANSTRFDGQDDRIELILWYKLPTVSNESTFKQQQHDFWQQHNSMVQQPIYSVDGRQVRPPATATTTNTQQQQRKQSAPESSNKAISPLLELIASPEARHFAHSSWSSRISHQFRAISKSGQQQKRAPTRGQRDEFGGKQNVPAARANKAPSPVDLALSSLHLKNASRQDAGLYKCRVDFRFARTRAQIIKLDVIEPVNEIEFKIGDIGGAKNTKTTLNDVDSNWIRHQDDESKGASASDLISHDNRTTANASSLAANSSSSSTRSAGPAFAMAMAQPNFLKLRADQTLQISCTAKNGWPDARLAWWRLDLRAGKRQVEGRQPPPSPAQLQSTSTRALGRHYSLTQLSLGAPELASARLQVSSAQLMPEWRKLEGRSFGEWAQIRRAKLATIDDLISDAARGGADNFVSDTDKDNKLTTGGRGPTLANNNDPHLSGQETTNQKNDTSSRWIIDWLSRELLDRSSSPDSSIRMRPTRFGDILASDLAAEQLQILENNLDDSIIVGDLLGAALNNNDDSNNGNLNGQKKGRKVAQNHRRLHEPEHRSNKMPSQYQESRDWSWLAREIELVAREQGHEVALLVCGALNVNVEKLAEKRGHHHHHLTVAEILDSLEGASDGDANPDGGPNVDSGGHVNSLGANSIPTGKEHDQDGEEEEGAGLAGDIWPAPPFKLLPIQIEAGPSWIQIIQIIRAPEKGEIVQLKPLESGSTIQLDITKSALVESKTNPAETLEMLCLGSFWPGASRTEPGFGATAGLNWRVSQEAARSQFGTRFGSRADSVDRILNAYAHASGPREAGAHARRLAPSSLDIDAKLDSDQVRSILAKYINDEQNKTTTASIDIDNLRWISLKLTNLTWHLENPLKIECALDINEREDASKRSAGRTNSNGHANLSVNLVSKPILGRPRISSKITGSGVKDEINYERERVFLAIGRQITLDCPVLFANPRLLQRGASAVGNEIQAQTSLDWLVNGNLIRRGPLQSVGNKTIQKHKTPFSIDIGENKQSIGLNVDQLDGSSISFSLRHEGSFNFTCQARNELGLGQSLDRLSLISGPAPRCLASPLSSRPQEGPGEHEPESEANLNANVNISTIKLSSSDRNVEFVCPLESAAFSRRDADNDKPGDGHDAVRFHWLALEPVNSGPKSRKQKQKAQWNVIASSHSKSSIELWKLYQLYQQYYQQQRQYKSPGGSFSPSTTNINKKTAIKSSNQPSNSSDHQSSAIRDNNQEPEEQHGLNGNKLDPAVERVASVTGGDNKKANEGESRESTVTFGCYATDNFGSNQEEPCIFNVVVAADLDDLILGSPNNQVPMADSGEPNAKTINSDHKQPAGSLSRLDRYPNELSPRASQSGKDLDQMGERETTTTANYLVPAVNSQKRSSHSVDRFMRTSQPSESGRWNKFWDLGIGLGVSLLATITILTLVWVYKKSTRGSSRPGSKAIRAKSGTKREQEGHQYHNKPSKSPTNRTTGANYPASGGPETARSQQLQQQMVLLGSNKQNQTRTQLSNATLTTPLSLSTTSSHCNSREPISNGEKMMQSAVLVMKANPQVVSNHSYQINQSLDGLSRESSLACSCSNNGNRLESNSSQQSFADVLFMTPSPLESAMKASISNKSLLKKERCSQQNCPIAVESPIQCELFPMQPNYHDLSHQANELNSFGEAFVTDETSSFNHEDSIVLITPNGYSDRHHDERTLTMVNHADTGQSYIDLDNIASPSPFYNRAQSNFEEQRMDRIVLYDESNPNPRLTNNRSSNQLATLDNVHQRRKLGGERVRFRIDDDN